MKQLAPILLMFVGSLTAGTITKTITFSEQDLLFEKANGYDLVMLKGESELAELGKPLLPKRSIHFLIPQDAEITKVQILDQDEQELPGVYNIHPGQKPVPFSHPELYEFIPPDEEIYASNRPYPDKRFAFYPSGLKSGFRLAGVDI